MPRSHAAEDQQSEQEVQQDQADARDALPGEVLSLMSVLQPGDAQALARIVATYPQYREQILQKAASIVGNETVSAAAHANNVPAMATAATPHPDRAPDPSTVAAEMQEVQEEKVTSAPAAAQGPQDAVSQYAADVKNDEQDRVATAAKPQMFRAPDPNSWEQTVQIQVANAENAKDLSQILKMHPTLRQQILDEAGKYLSADEIQRAVRMADAPVGGAAQEEEQQRPPEPAPGEPKPGDAPPGLTTPDEAAQTAWIGQARAYNAAHEELAGEFNILTSFSCLGADSEAGRTLDPVKVAAWQRAFGLEPDGKVGPRTVAAAREYSKRTQGVAPAPVDEDLLNNLE